MYLLGKMVMFHCPLGLRRFKKDELFFHFTCFWYDGRCLCWWISCQCSVEGGWTPSKWAGFLEAEQLLLTQSLLNAGLVLFTSCSWNWDKNSLQNCWIMILGEASLLGMQCGIKMGNNNDLLHIADIQRKIHTISCRLILEPPICSSSRHRKKSLFQNWTNSKPTSQLSRM